MSNHIEKVDLIGIGVGPFNLSLAALLSPLKEMRARFFDQKKHFFWHAGMLLPGSKLQVNYMKDLVTLVDPTNPYSFVSYLSKQKRLYRFILSQFQHVLRDEFNQYLHWVSQSLPSVHFQEEVMDVNFDKNAFSIQTSRRRIRSQHLVLGSGLKPYVPSCTGHCLGQTVFHSNDFMSHVKNWSDKRIVVLGGGQSGAEIVNYLISGSHIPLEITWITRRNQFLPMDESAFVSEYYTPEFNKAFYRLPDTARSESLQEQTLSSDGISIHLLEEIYQKLYVLECIKNQKKIMRFYPNHQLTKIDSHCDGHKLFLTDLKLGFERNCLADIVILCTGYQWEFPDYLAPLHQKIKLKNDKFCVNPDYSIIWDGPEQNRIYVQNGARHTHGVADSNLSLMAWRSAAIINSIAEHQVYDIDDDSSAIDWKTLVPVSNEAWRNVSNG